MKLRASICIFLLMALRGPSVPPPSHALPWGLEDLWDQIGFVKNDGQFPPNVRLAYLAGRVFVAFEDSGFAVFFSDGNKESFSLPCSPVCRLVPLEPKGSSPSWQVGQPHRWRNKIPTFSRLRYEGLAHGVTVEFYPRHGDLEFDGGSGGVFYQAGSDTRPQLFAFSEALFSCHDPAASHPNPT